MIGFMGCGKSTIASKLAETLGIEKLEMDQVIEEREGMSISGIFEKYGEEYFRRRETELLESLRAEEGQVISCGGGAPMRQANVDAMRKAGSVALLTASPETVYERVKDSHDRPLLEQNKNIPFLAGLMEARREKYEAAADFVIETDGKSPEEICGEILENLGGKKGRA